METTTKNRRYVCSNNPKHQYDEITMDGLCEVCEFGKGILIETHEKSEIRPEHLRYPKKDIPIADQGLLLVLIEASQEMGKPAFQETNLPKRNIVANAVATTIMNLSRAGRANRNYFMPVIYGEKPKALLIKSFDQVADKYGNYKRLAENLLSGIIKNSTKKADINKAFAFAKTVYDTVTQKNDLSDYGGPKNIELDTDCILPRNGESQLLVKKMRVHLFVSGHLPENQNIINPFKNEPVDLVTTIHFGQGTEPEIKKIYESVSKCQWHGWKQFIQINKPERISPLRSLYRGGNAPPGFCPLCIDVVHP